jgi:pimeloyl-ACP methyl ester carboxylesterase
VPRQVDDLEAVLRAERIERATLFGWSMGVQVALEAYRRLPGFAEALVLLNGTFGRPLDTAVPLPFARRFVPPALHVAERFHQPVGRVMRALAAQPEFVSMMKRFGMMADTVDESEFTDIAVAFAGLDVEVFLRTLRALGDHDASRILPRIDVPVLVVAGDQDRMTPTRALAADGAQDPARRDPRRAWWHALHRGRVSRARRATHRQVPARAGHRGLSAARNGPRARARARSSSLRPGRGRARRSGSRA